MLSPFLLPENVVPVVLVGFGYWLLTFAHTLFFWCSVRFVFSLGSGFRLGFDNLILGDRFFRRSVFGLINWHYFSFALRPQDASDKVGELTRIGGPLFLPSDK